MADILTDGRTKVSWVTTIANTAAPTAVELTAGIALQSVLTPDGLVNFAPSTAEVDTSSLDSEFTTALPGRTSYSGLALRIKKQSGTDTVFAALDTKDTRGFVAIRRGTDADTAWTAADIIEVYPAATGQYFPLSPEANTVQRYEVPITITAEPKLAAVVA